jgi:hypothetical protein
MENIVLTSQLEDIKVGSRVAVYRPDDDRCHKATVTQVMRKRNTNKPLFLEYEDGECGWIELGKHTFRILPEEICRHSKDHETKGKADSLAKDDSTSKNVDHVDEEAADVNNSETLYSSVRLINGETRPGIDQPERDVREAAVLEIVSEPESAFSVQQVEACTRSAIIVQSLVRQGAAKKVAEQKRRERMARRATAVQSIWRGYWKREKYHEYVQDVIFVQKVVRGRVARSVAEEKRQELRDKIATAIQTAWRRDCARTSFKRHRVNIIILQCMVRCRAARNVVENKRHETRSRSAQKIQNASRSFCACSSSQSDEDANEAELGIARNLETTPFRPVQGNKRRHFDQLKSNSKRREVEDDNKRAKESEFDNASEYRTSLFCRVKLKNRRCANPGEINSRSRHTYGDEKVANDCERPISSKPETSSFHPVNTKKRRRVTLEIDSRSKTTVDANRSEPGEMNVVSPRCGVVENKRRCIDQTASDTRKGAMLDIGFESESGSAAQEDRAADDCHEKPDFDFEHESVIHHSLNTENMTKCDAVSTDVALHEEVLLEKASEISERDPPNGEDEKIQELHETSTRSVTQDLMSPISAISGKDWNADLSNFSSPNWDFDDDFIDFAPIPLSDSPDKTSLVINELLGDEVRNIGDYNDIENHAVSSAATIPRIPLLCTELSPDNVEVLGEPPRTMESAAGNFGASSANGTPLLAVFRCIPLQEPMLSMHLRLDNLLLTLCFDDSYRCSQILCEIYFL